MKKRLMICAMCVSLTFAGCSRKSEVLMSYSGSDARGNDGIGTYVNAVSADFLSNSLCVVMDDENHMADEVMTGKAALMINDTTHEVVYANNVYERIYPASTTKLMTALLVLKYGNLEDKVTVKEDNGGITVPGAKLCNFKAGDSLTLGGLLNCLLVYSGNDAANAIAEYMYGSEEAFVTAMNEEAALIGATNSHFVNAHGLHDPNHYTTAYDMYLIFRECLKYDAFLPVINQKTYSASITDKDGKVRTKSYETTNMFLLGTKESPEGVTVFGGKTGSTGDAGDCLVLYSKSGEQDYISAVFKASSKNNLYDQMAHLLGME